MKRKALLFFFLIFIKKYSYYLLCVLRGASRVSSIRIFIFMYRERVQKINKNIFMRSEQTLLVLITTKKIMKAIILVLVQRNYLKFQYSMNSKKTKKKIFRPITSDLRKKATIYKSYIR